MKRNKIYLLTNKTKAHFEEFDSGVVIAKNEESAFKFANKICIDLTEKNTTINEIGIAHENEDEGIISLSFQSA